MSPARPDLVECWIFRLPAGPMPPGGSSGAADREPGADPGPAAAAPAPSTPAASLAPVASPAPAESAPEPEFLLIRRAPDRIFPGLWQCVTGGLEVGERVPIGALREVREELGFGPGEIEAFYDLDQVTHFYDEDADGVIAAAIFAIRARPDAVARLSHEHVDFRWVSREEALRLVVWPTYRETIDRIVAKLLDPDVERWFRLDPWGRRLAR